MSAAEPLLTTAELAALHEDIVGRRARLDAAAGSDLTGPYPSAHRGLGLELYESRPYRAGDEPRHIDWRATARSGRPMSKVFRAEQHRSIFLIVDRSPTMAFATRGELKAAVAARAAAILSFAAVAAHEPAAGAVLDAQMQVFPGARTAEGVLDLLRAAAAPLAATTTPQSFPLGEARTWEWLDRAAPAHATVYILSDLQFLSGALQGALARLAARREVWALQIVDPGEETLPDAGLLRLRPPASDATLVVDTGNPALRQAYAERMAQRLEEQTDILRTSNVRLRRLYTNTDPRTALQEVA